MRSNTDRQIIPPVKIARAALPAASPQVQDAVRNNVGRGITWIIPSAE